MLDQIVLSSWKESSILNPTGAPKALKQIFKTQSSGSQAGPVKSKEKNLALLRNHKAGLVRGAQGTETNRLAEEVSSSVLSFPKNLLGVFMLWICSLPLFNDIWELVAWLQEQGFKE